MNKIEIWKKKVNDYYYEIMNKINANDLTKNLHYGMEVIDGKIITNPLILFIGINPGRGNEKVKNIFESNKISYLDIFNDDYRTDYPNKYHLAEKTIRFFKLIGWKDEKIKNIFNNNVVKTNFYYLATKNMKDLNYILNQLKIKNDYYKKSASFTVELIKILKPKIVILEGKNVFDLLLSEWYPNNEDWKNKQFTFVKDDNLNTSLIAYNRNINNRNRELFIKKLKEILEQ